MIDTLSRCSECFLFGMIFIFSIVLEMNDFNIFCCCLVCMLKLEPRCAVIGHYCWFSNLKVKLTETPNIVFNLMNLSYCICCPALRLLNIGALGRVFMRYQNQEMSYSFHDFGCDILFSILTSDTVNLKNNTQIV